MGAIYENGTWVIEGNLPLGITTGQTDSGLVFYSAEGESQPECFGMWWEKYGPPEETAECRSCVFTDLCLEKMAKARLPEARARVNKLNPSLEELSKALDVNDQAVLAIVAHARGDLPATPPKKKRAPVTDETVTAVALGEEPATSDGGERGKPRDPSHAPSAKSAVDGARRKKAPSARRAKQPDVPRKKTWTWGTHTFTKRFLRERRQNNLIGAIPIGTVLETKYKKTPYQCTCLNNGWQYQGERFPTLQAVTEAIVGKVERPKSPKSGNRAQGTRKLCNYSAAKFWKLHKTVPEILKSGCLPGSRTADTRLSKTG